MQSNIIIESYFMDPDKLKAALAFSQTGVN